MIEHGYTTTNLWQYIDIITRSKFKWLNGDTVRTNFTLQKRDGQTNKNIETFRPSPEVARSPSPTLLAVFDTEGQCRLYAVLHLVTFYGRPM